MIEFPSDGLMVRDGRMWTRCIARKAGQCVFSGVCFEPGTPVYRPTGNGKDRMQRVKADLVEATNMYTTQMEITRLRAVIHYLGSTIAGPVIRQSIAARALRPDSTYTPGT